MNSNLKRGSSACCYVVATQPNERFKKMIWKSAAVAVILATLPAAADTLGSSARFAPTGSPARSEVIEVQNVLPREELRERLGEQRERAKDLEAQLLLTRQERDRLASQVERLREGRPEKNAEIREMRQEIRALRQAMIDLEAANDRKDLRIAELRERLDNRNVQVEELRAANEVLRAQLAAVREAIAPAKR